MNNFKSALPFAYNDRAKDADHVPAPVSFYLKSFDGTKLALDVFIPEDTSRSPFPAIIMVTREHRRNEADFEVQQCRQFACYGYAIIIVELRGCGVSYGINDSFCNEAHCRDLLSVIDWTETQSWCNGKIGIYGGSNRAFIQLCAGALSPRNITAINPVVAVADFYYQNFPNGVSACPNIHLPKPDCIPSKEAFLKTAVPVDEDPHGDMAYEAFSIDQWDHNKNFFETLVFPDMNRDTPHPLYQNEKTNMTIPPYGKLEAFYQSGVKQHQFIGELESGTLGQLALFLDYGGTVCLGPWSHEGAIKGTSPLENGDFSVRDAYLKWYDYILKGENNGWDMAPPVSYYMIHAPKGTEWRFSENWPPENESRTTLYFNAEKSGTSRSCNDGILSRNKENTVTKTVYQVRDDIVVFPNKEGISSYNRSELLWDGDMEPSVDCKGLTFTSAPLFPIYQNEFAGCISVKLWISCDQPDIDLIVYAEEVLPNGRSLYIKDGVMRASHRIAGSNPAWEKMGAVWHTSMTEDVQLCLDEGLESPTLLEFAIDPTCYHFQKDSRIRITITCANNAAFQHTMYHDRLPVLTLYTGGTYDSSVSVPFLEHDYHSFSGTAEIDGTISPANLYCFHKNTYLCAGKEWLRFPTIRENQLDGMRLTLNEHVSFTQHGKPSIFPTAGLAVNTEDYIHPTARFPRILIDRVHVSHRDYTLFVPQSKTLYMDLFHPCQAEQAPCIVFVHGYGAAPNELPPQLQMMYRSGYAIACMDLRPYPPNLYPDYIQDIKGGIRYLRAHAQELCINPNQIGIYGFSLGGNTSLMIALTGDDPALEGTVGGNQDYSSEVQAAACGFAWCDLLNLGSDIAQEKASTIEKSRHRVELTEGEFSPSSEVIGFAGKGRGLRVLRKYSETGKSDNDDSWLDEKLKQAFEASPVNHITPSAPPIALFGGYGDDGINIAFRQCLRAFNALDNVGIPAFLFGNTNGKYGETETVMAGIRSFFDSQLSKEPDSVRLVITVGKPYLLKNNVRHPLLQTASSNDGGIWLPKNVLLPFLNGVQELIYQETDKGINLSTLTAKSLTVTYYTQFATVVIIYPR